jgi:cysteine-rich repeat protein
MRSLYTLTVAALFVALATTGPGCACSRPGPTLLAITVDATAAVSNIDQLDVTVMTAAMPRSATYDAAAGTTFTFPVPLENMDVTGLTGLATITVNGLTTGTITATGAAAATLVAGTTIPVTVTIDAGGPGKCGNGVVDVGEACDDGNATNGDGCENDCTVTPTVCGDGTVSGAEECDDGNTVGGDGCSPTCFNEPATCGVPPNTCDAGEDCMNCPSDCGMCVPVCGNGIIESGEDCEGGNLGGATCASLGFPGGGTLTCSATCVFVTTGCSGAAVCGNGTVEGTEECDDGNTTSGDGCSSTCMGEGPCAGVDCTALTNMCNIGVCNPASGACMAMPVTNGTSCSDGNLCTTGDTCQTGACTAGPPTDCSALTNACNTGTCNSATGACVATPLPGGTPCDDGLACTSGTTCTAGTCGGGIPLDCSAFTSTCSTGICAEPTGCFASPLADGTPCDDGDVCTDDVCLAGSCSGMAIGNDCDIYSTLVGGFIDASQSASATQMAVLSADNTDDTFEALTLPFSFPFFGVSTSSLAPTSNGFINVGATTSASLGNGAIPSTGVPNSAIYAFWDDLHSRTTGDVYVDYRGVSPNMMAIIQWKNYGRFGTLGDVYNFEAILHENGTIQLLYGESTGNTTGNLHLGASATSGIENAAGTIGFQFSNNTATLVPGLIINFVPDGAGSYVMTSTNNVVAPWTDIRTAGTLVPGVPTPTNCDDCTAPVALPFNFSFFGTTYGPGLATGANVHVGSNGYVQFGLAPTTYLGSPAFPTTSGPENAIGVFVDDLYSVDTVVAGSDVKTQTLGVAPNRTFVIQWINFEFCCGDAGNNLNFEIVLHETTNAIELLYGPQTGPTGFIADQVIGASATAGLNNSTGTVGYNASTDMPNLGQGAVITFIPNSNTDTTAYSMSGPNTPFPDISRAAGVLASTVTADDGVESGVPIGFTFTFYGVPYTTLSITDNGFIGFDTYGGGEWTNSAIPTAFAPNNFIAAYWGDMDIATNGPINYVTTGPVGSRVFTVQYQSLDQYAASGAIDVTFAITLSEATGAVDIYYGGMLSTGGGTSNGGNAGIGIENGSGLSGIETGINDGGTTLSGTHFTYYP